ncbi:MAG: hypothetical protein ACYTGL_30560 [Planctomycetota bacterium]|jgi:Ca2+-binding EF-hand superfamily protein
MNRFRCCFLSVALLSAAGPLTAQDADSKPAGDAASPANLFDQLDKNSDGTLTKDEVPEEQQRFFERLVRLGDGNDDGKLTKAEFQSATAEQPAPSGQRGAGRPGQGGSRFGDPRQFFNQMDRNGDGKVERDELPEQARERMGRLFDALGKDSFTLEEMMQIRQRMQGGNRPNSDNPGNPGGRPVGQRGNPEETFKRLDANGDGKLLLSEVPEQARRFFGPMFQRLGKSPDDAVTRDEFLEAARRFRQQDGQPRPDGNRPQDGDRPKQQRPADGDRPRGPRFVAMLDANRDGRLSRDELSRIISRFGELDMNDDGQIDMRELFGAPPQGRDGRPQGQEGRPLNRRPESDQPETRPRRPESDSPPGESTPSRNSSRSSDSPRGSLDIATVFRRLDRNKDGGISEDEAVGRLKGNFDRVDADGDGKVSEEELRKARSRRN